MRAYRMYNALDYTFSWAGPAPMELGSTGNNPKIQSLKDHGARVLGGSCMR